MLEKKGIAVIGAGAWGTAIACLLAYNGYHPYLWCRDEETAKQMQKTRRIEKYLPNIELHKNIVISSDLDKVIENKEIVFLAVLSIAMEDVISKIHINPDSYYVICSKGYDYNSKEFMSDIALNYIDKPKLFILSGPNFAIDVANGKPSTTSIACYGYDKFGNYTAEYIKEFLHSKRMKVHINDSPIGTQLCGLMKNIYAILVGIIRGSDNNSENTIAMIIGQAIKEIRIMIYWYKGNADTVLEPCGISDLVMTCYSKLSRNMSLGYKIGKSEKIDYNSSMPEGYYAVDIINRKDLPICETVHKILYPEKYPKEKNEYQTLLNKLYEVL